MKKFLFQLGIAAVAVMSVGCGDKNDDMPTTPQTEAFTKEAASGSDADVSAALNAIDDLKQESVGATYFVVEIPVTCPTSGTLDLSSANVASLVEGDKIELKFADAPNTAMRGADTFSVVAPMGCTANVDDKVIISKNARIKGVSTKVKAEDWSEKYDIAFEYNSEGKLSKIVEKYIEEGSDGEGEWSVDYLYETNTTSTFAYNEDVVNITNEVVKSDQENGDIEKDTYSYDETWKLDNGRIAKVEGVSEYPYEITKEYLYNGSKLKSLTETETINDDICTFAHTYDCTWVGDNLVSYDRDSGSQDSYEYDSSLLNNANLDTNALIEGLSYSDGAVAENLVYMTGSASRNLMSKFTNIDIAFTYKYTLSESGLVTAVEGVDGKTTITVSFIYE